MNSTKIILIITLALCIGCKKDPKTGSFKEGTYEGVFERNGEQAKVNIVFSKGIFSGKSETIKFPAICEGKYVVEDDKVFFSNGCFWSADFDWTLILTGEWEHKGSGDELILTKSNGDVYSLKKP
ncbi:MAG: hypothetical protein H6605_07840 [Flavobacteriales bacterium]|nr:hypothetical protein [Flavobacteriales bacterium]